MHTKTKNLPLDDTARQAKTKTKIRLRGLQAAFGAMCLDLIPGGLDVANLVGIDPIAHAKRQMLKELGKQGDQDTAGHGNRPKVLPLVTKQATRGFIRVVAKTALKGTRFAAVIAKRGALVVTVVSSVTSGIGAYRELTTVGFAALDED